MFKNLREAGAHGPVLITGHTGFKGSWLSLMLDHLEINHFGLSLEPEANSHAQLTRLDTFTNHIYLDIRNAYSIQNAIAEIRPSVIVHMAAQPIVSRAFENIVETYETNVNGTMNVIEAARRNSSVESVAVITTDKVYASKSGSDASYKESDALGSNEPYGLSKVAAELVVDSYNITSNFKNNIYTFRSGNVIGGGDTTQNRLLPDLARHIFYETPLEIRNFTATRPWQHVLDTLTGYLMGVETNLSGENHRSFNFAPFEPSLSVSEVLEVVSRNYSIKYTQNIKGTPSSKVENVKLDLDSTKAREILGWKNQFTQESAILDTLNWWREIESGASALELARKSISKYFSKLEL